MAQYHKQQVPCLLLAIVKYSHLTDTATAGLPHHLSCIEDNVESEDRPLNGLSNIARADYGLTTTQT